MRIKNRKIRKFVIRLNKISFLSAIFDYFIKLILGNKLYRSIVTKGFSSKKLAIGEQNKYGIDSSWITVDMSGADFNFDFRIKPTIPMSDSSVKLIYCSHVVEHLSDDANIHVFNESYRLLETGGVFRIEAPDLFKIIAAYRNRNQKFFLDLMSDDEKKHSSIEQVFVGLLSCYIVNGHHVPVSFDTTKMHEKLNTLSDSEFAMWCVSLLSPAQYKTGGHINPMSFEKLSKLLKAAGFSDINVTNTGLSSHSLMVEELSGIEREHRGFYSVILEAVK